MFLSLSSNELNVNGGGFALEVTTSCKDNALNLRSLVLSDNGLWSRGCKLAEVLWSSLSKNTCFHIWISLGTEDVQDKETQDRWCRLYWWWYTWKCVPQTTQLFWYIVFDGRWCKAPSVIVMKSQGKQGWKYDNGVIRCSTCFPWWQKQVKAVGEAQLWYIACGAVCGSVWKKNVRIKFSFWSICGVKESIKRWCVVCYRFWTNWCNEEERIWHCQRLCYIFSWAVELESEYHDLQDGQAKTRAWCE